MCWTVSLFVCFSTLSPHQDAPLSPKPPSPDSDSCPSSPKPPASVSTHLVSALQRLGLGPGLLTAARVAAYRRVSAQSSKHSAQNDKRKNTWLYFHLFWFFPKGWRVCVESLSTSWFLRNRLKKQMGREPLFDKKYLNVSVFLFGCTRKSLHF